MNWKRYLVICGAVFVPLAVLGLIYEVPRAAALLVTTFALVASGYFSPASRARRRSERDRARKSSVLWTASENDQRM